MDYQRKWLEPRRALDRASTYVTHPYEARRQLFLAVVEGTVRVLDPSTLTRNLAVMLKHGWIEEVPDDGDQRGAPLQTTATGRKLLQGIAPAWHRAQSRAKKCWGAARSI